MANKDSVESVVRRIGRLLDDRYDNPSVEDLREDDDFEEAVERLCTNDVNAERVAKFCRESSTAVACAAIEAVRRRRDAPRVWRTWAVRQTSRVNHVTTCFLLHTLAWGPVGEPMVVRVLAQSDNDWHYDSLMEEVAWFVQQRLELGEELAAADLGKGLKPEHEPFVTSLLRHFEGEAPEAFASAVAEWRRSQIDLDFFREFAEIVEPTSIGAELIGGRERALDAILDAAAASPRRSVLLVGEHGVGKSTVAREAAALLSVDGWVTIRATASDVHAGQVYTGELETRLTEIAKRTDGRAVLWLLPNLEEALWAGQHSRSPRGMLDTLLPHLQTGRLVIVGEIDPTAYELLVQTRPRVKSAFTVVRLAPFAEADALRLARGALTQAGLKASDQTLRESFELAEHYLPAVASPGGLLRVLDQAAARLPPDADEVTTRGVLDGISDASGLPLHILDARVPLDLGAVRATFERRVLGQPEAVECLIERIAMIKAGLTDPTRPLGVFLFVGPTGTGKTEIAKTLAEFVFGSSSRLVRLDMSEFQTSESHERLLADSAVEEYGAASLISSVRRDPFSVVLLDEFEKAHSNIWDLFLQVFDDGRLTDSRGRTVDFRHCVFVLTSNIGSAIPSGVGVGFERDEGHFAPAGVERAVARSFRPELLNRLDRVVVFRPLERETMRSLLRNELASVLERRGFRTLPWAVEWDESAVDFLLDRGFSAELGARPLKRAVERFVLAPLAMAIAERQFPEGDQFLFLTAGEERIDVTFVDPDADGDPAPAVHAAVDLALERLVSEPQGTADEVQFLCGERDRLGPLVEGWSGRKADALVTMAEPEFWERPDRTQVLGFVEYVDRLEAAWRTGVRLTARLEGGNGSRPATKAVGIVAQRLYVLDRAVEGLRRGEAADAFVRVVATGDQPDAHAFAAELVAMYESWASARGMRFERTPGSEGQTLAISGLGAYPILAPESGVHVLEQPKGEHGSQRLKVRVTVVAQQLAGADGEREPADDAFRRLRGRRPGIVRRYRREPSPLVRDAVRGWRTGRLDRVLAGDFDVVV
jgi:ATP-dependent Clp protease ATP-binding subunit ClpC